MDKMDFDSFLAKYMLPIDDACDCCKTLLESMEYIEEWEEGQKKRRLKGGEKHD